MLNLSNVSENEDIATKKYVDDVGQNCINYTNNKIKAMTQQEYDAIQNKEQNVLYCIYEE